MELEKGVLYTDPEWRANLNQWVFVFLQSQMRIKRVAYPRVNYGSNSHN